MSHAEGSLAGYDPVGSFCEMLGRADAPAAHTVPILRHLAEISVGDLELRAQAAERELYNLGITFTLYSESTAVDRILPFDVIPRLLSPADWEAIESGVVQRVTALNLFLHDVYHEQKVLKDRVVPSELVLGNANFRPEMMNVAVPHGTYVHVCGIDLVRDQNGRFMVLEDNARVPSGVSYVVENRHLMLRAFPDLMSGMSVQPVRDYGTRLQAAMIDLAPAHVDEPQVVLLSPGAFNSAYFEHVFLAREAGIPLVEGRDLVVNDDTVYMKTTGGPVRVDVIYRRVNDDFLDPEAFRSDSMLGVSGLMRAYRKGNVAVANAVGTGACDDKAVYTYMPRIIRYYLDQDPILPNVETHNCREKDGLAYTLEHLEELVVKPVGEAGGYGITVGPRASAEEIEQCRSRLRARPDNYVSQPMVQLSVCPTLVDGRVEPRHVDLRPFAITGRSTWVLPGGLTRVALPRGSIIVNSSQGGGSKDTWVLE